MKFAFLIEPPFCFRTQDGTVTGCDVDVARQVVRELGIDSFDPVEATFAELLPGLTLGRWRMTTGLFVTEERQQIASFSQPIWALSDGLLVRLGNPHQIIGYKSIARNSLCIIAVIREQYQHRSATEFGIPDRRIAIFETYTDAANAVAEGKVDAYASVERAHRGFVERNPGLALDVVTVPTTEKMPTAGAFAFCRSDNALRQSVNQVLGRYVGSPEHRKVMMAYGFSDHDIDRLTGLRISPC